MPGLGLFYTEGQSEHEMAISEYTISLIAARDFEVSKEAIRINGWFDIPEDHPDRYLGDITYVQAIDVAYNEQNHSALYGITDDGKIHMWAS
jgi:hypothetical protein